MFIEQPYEYVEIKMLRTTLGTKRRPGLGKVVIVYSELSGRKPKNQSHTDNRQQAIEWSIRIKVNYGYQNGEGTSKG